MLMLAWRNIWRNKRRSLITIASMGAGLAAIMFGQSMLKSLQHQLVEKATSSIAGHLQIQRRGIKDLKFPDVYIENLGPAEKALSGNPMIKAWAKRIAMTGLVSSPEGSVGVLINAIDVDNELKITNISQYLTEGEFLGKNARGIVMGDKLAQRLKLRMGEKAVLMAQAEDGSMGAEAFRLVGIYHSGSNTFDGQMVYVHLPAMQELLGVGKKVNHFVARVDDPTTVDEIQSDLTAALDKSEPIHVVSWKQVDFEIVGIQKFQNALLDVVLFVVFAIVALGILNTLLMSFFERIREFGVLMAIGAKPAWVMKLVLAESLLLGAIGTVLGLAAGSAMISWYGARGLHLPVGEAFSYFLPFPSVIYLRFSWPSHQLAAVMVLVTSVIAAISPSLRACRLRPAEALRHV